MTTPEAIGLGVDVDVSALGEPLLVVR